MIIDTSAIVTILRDEPDARRFATALAKPGMRRMSAATYVELGAVIDGARDPIVSRRLDELLEAANVLIEPLTELQARIARDAYRDFGRGSGHKASLNLGDCFAYALAKCMGEPLLFKGADLAQTDVQVA